MNSSFKLVDRNNTYWGACMHGVRPISSMIAIEDLGRSASKHGVSCSATPGHTSMDYSIFDDTPLTPVNTPPSTPVLSSSALPPSPSLETRIHRFQTLFDPQHPSNKRFTASRGLANIEGTERERERASTAERIDTLDDLSIKVSNHSYLPDDST